MQLNQAGIDLIKRFEGCKLKAYPDPATGGPPWTVGYGHTGVDVTPKTVWTQAKADEALTEDLARLCVHVQKLIKIALTDNEFSAIISLGYNIGAGNLAKSTLLKIVNEGLNDDDSIQAAANEFLRWNKASGKVMAGLTDRRHAEAALFVT